MLCVEHEMVLLDAPTLNHVSISWFDSMHDREKRPKMMALLNVSMLILKYLDRDWINHFNIWNVPDNDAKNVIGQTSRLVSDKHKWGSDPMSP